MSIGSVPIPIPTKGPQPSKKRPWLWYLVLIQPEEEPRMLRTRLHRLLAIAVFFAVWTPSVPVAADCYTDCMNASGCWSHRSDENVSYCSDTQARCSSDCRDAGSGDDHRRGKSYGAIAYSAKDGIYGYSHGWTNQKKAETVAMGYCKESGGKKCKKTVAFADSCGAVAADGKKFGVGKNKVRMLAIDEALKKCARAGGKNCAPKISDCSG